MARRRQIPGRKKLTPRERLMEDAEKVEGGGRQRQPNQPSFSDVGPTPVVDQPFKFTLKPSFRDLGKLISGVTSSTRDKDKR